MSLALSQNYLEASPIAQKVAAAASITASYTLVGSIFGQGLINLIIVSTLDQPVQISLDGVTDWIPIPAGATLIIDLKSNLSAFGGWRGVYVKQIGVPTTGSLYVSGIGV